MLQGTVSPPESVGDADADTNVGELTAGSVRGLLALRTLLALKVTVSLNGSLVGAAESLVGADVGSRMPRRRGRCSRVAGGTHTEQEMA
jgi:hypothetical protein